MFKVYSENNLQWYFTVKLYVMVLQKKKKLIIKTNSLRITVKKGFKLNDFNMNMLYDLKTIVSKLKQFIKILLNGTGPVNLRLIGC